jgi:hypothetical protein
MGHATLKNLLLEGRLKTAHESGKSTNKAFDSDRRQKFEESYFGDTPIYGYLSDSGPASEETMRYPDVGKMEVRDDCSHYGEVRVRLKNSIRSRTTFVVGDSWDNNRASIDVLLERKENKPDYKDVAVTQLASPVDKPSFRSVPNFKDYTPAQQEHIIGTGDRDHWWYYEAQVHGGVSVGDVEHIAFYDKLPSKNVQAQLGKLGITWEKDSHVESPRTKAIREGTG